MDIIYRILKQFRFLFRNRQIKKFITFALIIILISMLCSRVFGFTVEEYEFADYKKGSFDTTLLINTHNVIIVDDPNGAQFAYTVFFISKSFDLGDIYIYSNTLFLKNSTSSTLDYYELGYDENLNCVFQKDRTLSSGNSTSISYYPTDIVYSSVDITNYNGDVIYFNNNKFNYEISLSTEEETSEPVIAYTNWLDYDYFSNYAVHVVLYPDTAESLTVTNLNYEIDNENNLFRYYFEIEENGDYMFVFDFNYNDFRDLKTVTKTVSNIVVNSGGESGENNNDNENTVSGNTVDYTQNFNNLENTISGTTTAINETNNFLQDTTVDDSQFQMPTVEVNDPTANFFDTMFTGIYNAVTTDEDKTINISLLGNNIAINSADFNVLQANEWTLLRVILSAMWTIGIGLYILKDIRKMIDKIKDGNIENVTNDDIKADIV